MKIITNSEFCMFVESYNCDVSHRVTVRTFRSTISGRTAIIVNFYALRLSRSSLTRKRGTPESRRTHRDARDSLSCHLCDIMSRCNFVQFI